MSSLSDLTAKLTELPFILCSELETQLELIGVTTLLSRTPASHLHALRPLGHHEAARPPDDRQWGGF